MREHIRILGILTIILSSLSILGGLLAAAAMGGIAGMAAMADSGDGAAVPPWFGLLGLGVGAFFVLLGLPGVIGAWGLLNYKPWSRVWMIVVSALHLLHFPFGTALGAYGLWVLTNEQSRQLLESGGAFPQPPVAMPQSGLFPS